MSNFSTKSYCRPSRGMTYRNGRKELYSKHTRKSLRKRALTRDKIAPVCASSYNWVNLKFLVICSTTSSSSFCDRWVSIWPSETRSSQFTASNNPQRGRSLMKRQSGRARFYRLLPGGQEDVLPLHPCTISRPSRYDTQDRNDCHERQNPGCMMSERHSLSWSTRIYPPTCVWKQSWATVAVPLTKAQVREGMG
jgi:hypothetical protein